MRREIDYGPPFVWKKDPRTYLAIAVLVAVLCVLLPAKDPATKDIFRHEAAYRAWKRNDTNKRLVEEGAVVDMDDCQRISVWFPCDHLNTKCHGWLYVPNAARQEPRHAVPIVLLGHGFGSQKDIGLEQFALAFIRRGIAAFAFDYRGFGASGGFPRHVISPWMHLDDWLTAIDFVASQKPGVNGSFELVDTSRLALWGTSLAGGHVIMAAAQRPDQVAAVVSQIPLMSGKQATIRSVKQRGLFGTLRLSVVVLSDFVRKWLQVPALRIPIIGREGELAMLQLEPEEIERYFSRKPADSEILGAWRNWAPARGAVSVRDYNPIERVHEVDDPILFLSTLKDTLCPHEFTQAGYEKAREGDAGDRAKLVTADATHFEAYVGDTAKLFMDEAAEFLSEHLKPHVNHRLHPRPQPFVPDEL
eukprot:jgi/Mesvir1/25958/Mv20948-RA.1